MSGSKVIPGKQAVGFLPGNKILQERSGSTWIIIESLIRTMAYDVPEWTSEG